MPILDAPVRHGQVLAFPGLQAVAAEAMDRAGLNMTQTAEKLGVSVPVISRALGANGGTRDAGVLSRIVAELSTYDVEDVTSPSYRLTNRERNEEHK